MRNMRAGMAGLSATKALFSIMKSAEVGVFSTRAMSPFWKADEGATAAGAIAESVQSGYLKYGDVVMLQLSVDGAVTGAANGASSDAAVEGEDEGEDSNAGGLMHGEGFVYDGLRVQTTMSREKGVRQCLFQVVPQLTYDAKKVQLKQQASQAAAKSGIMRARDVRRAARAAARLRKQLASEERANEHMINSLGEQGEQRVLYSDMVQLRHVVSGKYLSLIPRTTADIDRECNKVELAAGSDASIFRVRPRFRIFNDGAPISFGDQVTLVSAKIPTSCIHVSGTPGANEVNLSSAIHGWRVLRYLERTPQYKEHLFYGAAVRLYHPEAQAMLSASTSAIKREPALAPWAPPASAGNDTDSCKSIWLAESKNLARGGAVQWSDGVRFRHMTSGRYLAVESNSPATPGRDSGREMTLLAPPTSTDAKEVAAFDANTLFRLHAVEPTQETVVTKRNGESQTARLQHIATGRWLTNTKATTGTRGAPKGAEVSAGTRGLKLKVAASSTRQDEDAFSLREAEPSEVRALEMALCRSRLIEQYVGTLRMHVAAERTPVEGLPIAAISAVHFEPITTGLEAAIFGCLHQADTSQDATTVGMDESATLPVRSVQRLHREMKLVDAAVWALGVPASLGITGAHMHHSALAPLLRCHKLLYRLVSLAFMGSRRNELYISTRPACPTPATDLPQYAMADVTEGEGGVFIEQVISQVGDEVGAEECLRSMVSNNKELLETRVDQATLTKFVSLIGDKGPKDVFMGFMTALCSCEGQQVLSTQEDLLRIFMSPQREDGSFPLEQFKQNRRELLVETFADFDSPRRPLTSLSDEAFRKANPGEEPDHGDFLGRDLFANGIPLLCVSWHSIKGWCTGLPQLYHDPASMGLPVRRVKTPAGLRRYLEGLEPGADHSTVDAVPLASLVWVLEPENLCELELCGGVAWTEMEFKLRLDEEAMATHKLILQLAEYYRSMLGLFAEMCLDRSYNCIEAIEKQFSYDMLVAGIKDEQLPHSVRAQFSTLCERLYVDRYPHGELQLPRLVRLWKEVRPVDLSVATALPQFLLTKDSALRDIADPFFSLPTASKLHLLEDYISDHFEALGAAQVLDDEPMNVLTLNVLSILKKLAQQGFYGTIDEIVDLMGPLIGTLDARADCQTKEELDAMMQLLARVKRGPSSSGASSVVSSRGSSPTGGSTPSAGGATAGMGSKAERYRQVSAQSYQVLRCKEQMVQVVLHFGRVRLDYQLSCALAAFRETLDAEGEEGIIQPAPRRRSTCSFATSFEAAAEPAGDEVHDGYELTPAFAQRLLQVFTGAEAQAFDFDVMSDAPLVTICMDLAMYNKSELFDCAMQLLIRTFSQREDLVAALESVQLLSSDKALEAYGMLNSSLLTLRNDVESYETWGCDNDFSGADEAVITRVKDTLQRLINMCTVGDEEDTGVPNPENQTLFRNMLLPSIITRTLQIEDTAGEGGEEQPHLIDIKRLALGFISRFVLRNPVNQALTASKAFDSVVDLLTSKHYGQAATDAVIATYEGNRALATSVPEALIWRFAALIEDTHACGEPAQHLLPLFTNLLDVGGRPIARNAELILRVMGDSQFDDHVMVLYGAPGTVDRDLDQLELAKAHHNFVATALSQPDSPEAAFFPYHLGLVHTLALVTAGKAGNTEIKVQALYPLEHLLSLMMVGHATNDFVEMYVAPELHTAARADVHADPARLRARCAFSTLLYNAYLQAEHVSKTLPDTLRALSVLEFLKDEMRVLATQRSIGGDSMRYCVQGLIPCVVGVMDALSGEDDAAVDEMRKEVAAHASSIAAKLAGKLDSKAADAFNDKLTKLSIEAGELFVSKPALNLNANVSHLMGAVKVGHEAAVFAKLVEAVRNTPTVLSAIATERRQLVSTVLNIESLTDPEDEAFKRNRALQDEANTLYVKAMADIRKNRIPFHAFTRRVVEHMAKARGDAPASTYVDGLRLLSSILRDDIQAAAEAPNAAGERTLVEKRAKELRAALLQRQNLICDSGAAALVVKLLAQTDSDAVACCAMELGACLLQYGNAYAQQRFGDELVESPKTFVALEGRMRRGVALVKQRRKASKLRTRRRASMQRQRSGSFSDSLNGMLPTAISATSAVDEGLSKQAGLEYLTVNPLSVDLLYRFLQLLCEGHNLTLQNLLREQPLPATVSTNLLSSAMRHLLSICKSEEALTEHAEEADLLDVIRLLDFIVDAVQGPCEDNQQVVAETGLVAAYRTLLRSDFSARCLEGEDSVGVLPPGVTPILVATVKEVKSKSIKAVIACLEGRQDAIIHDEILSKVDVADLRARLTELHLQYVSLSAQRAATLSGDELREWSKGFLEEGFDVLGLMEALVGHRASVRAEIMPTALTKAQLTALELDELPTDTSEKDRERALQRVAMAMQYKEAHGFFTSRLRSVEVNFRGTLERVFFPVPSMCQHLLRSTKKALLANVVISSHDAKCKDFVERSQIICTEMVHINMLARWGGYRVLKNNIVAIKSINFALAVLINLALLVSFRADSAFRGRATVQGEGMTELIQIMGVINLVLAVTVLGYTLATRAPLIRARLKHEARPNDTVTHKEAWQAFSSTVGVAVMSCAVSGVLCLRYMETVSVVAPVSFGLSLGLIVLFVLKSLRKMWEVPIGATSINYCWMYDVLGDTDIRWQLFYLVACCVGYFYHPLAYSFTLFDLCMMSPILLNVLKSISLPAPQLGMTALLVGVLCYVFSFVSVMAFRESFGSANTMGEPSGELPNSEYECRSLGECFVMQLHFGLLSGALTSVIGQGGYDYRQFDGQTWGSKVTLDLAFFVVITVFMLNIVLGVIVDTFSALRSEQEEREEHLNNYCFISGTHRSQFDQLAAKTRRKEDKFEYHCKHAHNIWNYVKFMAYLREKDPTEYTGPESYVAQLLADEDTSWIPQFTSISLCEAGIDKAGAQQQQSEDVASLKAQLAELMKTMAEFKAA